MPVKEVSLPLKELSPTAPAAGLSAPPETIPVTQPAAVPLAAGIATRIDLDYILGSQQHCFWANVSGSYYPVWLNADQVKTIVPLAFAAPSVFIQSNDTTKMILRIRPIRVF